MRALAPISLLSLAACSVPTSMDSLDVEGADLRMSEAELTQMEATLLGEGEPAALVATTSCTFRLATDDELGTVSDFTFGSGDPAGAETKAVMEGIVARPATKACIAAKTAEFLTMAAS